METIREDGAAIRAATADAHFPSLAGAVAHLTSDLGVFRDGRPVYGIFGDGQGSFPGERKSQIADGAVAARATPRDKGADVFAAVSSPPHGRRTRPISDSGGRRSVRPPNDLCRLGIKPTREMIMKSAVVIGSAGVLLFASAVLAADAGGEIANAATHAGLAAQASDIAGVHTHLHHAVNCLVGPAGPGYDGKEMNPCANSGSGAIPDTTNASTKQKLEAALARANNGIAATDLATAQKDAATTEAMLKSAK